MKMKFFIYFSIIILFMVFSFSCSIKKLAMNKVADLLTSPGNNTVFTGDNDPELVGDAIPFAIKLYESLLAALPGHRGLQLQTGSMYIMYAYAFIQVPANMLTEDEYQEQEFLLKRAKNLFLRGRDILLNALEGKYPDFKKYLNENQFPLALNPVKKQDAPLLYWAGSGWLGAFAIDPFDMKLGITLPRAAALMNRVLELAENFNEGAIHDFFVLYYGSLPQYMGGDSKKARYHFKKSLESSKFEKTSPYISLATTVSVNEQNLEEFTRLLNAVLKINPDADPENRLVKILDQRKARWLLEHKEDFFLISDDEDNLEKDDFDEKEKESET